MTQSVAACNETPFPLLLETPLCGTLKHMTKAPKYGEYQEGSVWFTRKLTIVTIGLSESAVEELGEIESIEYPDVGGDFEKGEVVVTVEGAKGTIEITAPAAGLVEEVNESAKTEYTVVEEDPTEEGWLVKLEIQDKTDLKEFAED